MTDQKNGSREVLSKRRSYRGGPEQRRSGTEEVRNRGGPEQRRSGIGGLAQGRSGIGGLAQEV